MAIPGHSSYPMGWMWRTLSWWRASIRPPSMHLWTTSLRSTSSSKSGSLFLAVLALTILTFQIASAFGFLNRRFLANFRSIHGELHTRRCSSFCLSSRKGSSPSLQSLIYTTRLCHSDGRRVANGGHQRLQLGDIALLLCVTGVGPFLDTDGSRTARGFCDRQVASRPDVFAEFPGQRGFGRLAARWARDSIPGLGHSARLGPDCLRPRRGRRHHWHQSLSCSSFS